MKLSAKLKFALACLLLASATRLAATDIPMWWFHRGVLDSATSPDDFAVVNQGQVRNIAKQTYEEMKARGLVDPATQSTSALVVAWEDPAGGTDNFAAANLGQVKAVAKPFYDRLVSANVLSALPVWATTSNSAVDNYLVANVGQVKNLFAFPSLPPVWWVQTGATTSLSLPANLTAPVTAAQLYGFALAGYSALQSGLSQVGGAGSEIGTQTASWLASTQTQSGLRREYFGNTALSGSSSSVYFEAVDRSWGYDFPAGARWTGEVQTQGIEGDFVFQVASDTGTRLWVNDQLVFDQSDGGQTAGNFVASATVHLPANSWVPIRLEYNRAYAAGFNFWPNIHLSWSQPLPAGISGSGGVSGGAVVLHGTYYDNKGFSGSASEADEVVDFPSIYQQGFFSAHWSGSFVVEGGQYNLFTQADNGLRVSIDGHLIIDNLGSGDGSLQSQGGDDMVLGAGVHSIEIDYSHYSDNAFAHWAIWPQNQEFAAWEGGSSNSGNGVATGTGFSSGSLSDFSYGLRGEYFANTDLSGSPATITHGPVNYFWGWGSPAPDIPTDNFSARWTGWVVPQTGGYHAFHTFAYGGVRLWVNDQMVIDNWGENFGAQNQGGVWLDAGVAVSIRLEYYSGSYVSIAGISLGWTDGDPYNVVTIPMSQMINSDGGEGGMRIIPQQSLRWNPINETATIGQLNQVADLFRNRLNAVGYSGFHTRLAGQYWAVATVADLKAMLGFDLENNTGLDADGDGLAALVELLLGTDPDTPTTLAAPLALGLTIYTPLE